MSDPLNAEITRLTAALAEANAERAPVPRSEVIDRLRARAESAERELTEIDAALDGVTKCQAASRAARITDSFEHAKLVEDAVIFDATKAEQSARAQVIYWMGAARLVVKERDALKRELTEKAAALSRVEGERDEAVTFIRVIGEELAISGYPTGDRTVILASLRQANSEHAAAKMALADEGYELDLIPLAAKCAIAESRAEASATRVSELEAALRELVRLKNLKDRGNRSWAGCPLYGPGSWSVRYEADRLDYEKNQPLAWQSVIALLPGQTERQADTDSQEGKR